VGCPCKKSRKPKKVFGEVSFLEGLLVYAGEFTLPSPVGVVKPFLTLIRGERLEVASMDEGGPKIPGVVHKGGSRTIEPGRQPVAICLLHFLFLRPL
jgi:hypothetical protein